jgi:hypothetical protein
MDLLYTHLISLTSFMGTPNSVRILYSTSILTELKAVLKSMNSWCTVSCTYIFYPVSDECKNLISNWSVMLKLLHMACLSNFIRQPSSDISPICILLIITEVSNSQGRSIWCDRFFMGFCKVLVPKLVFIPLVVLVVGKKLVSQHSPFNPMHCFSFSWTWSVA